MSVDYKATVFLPRTQFPMRAGLPKREPEILARWAEMNLYQALREDAAGREKFILHDGPPYANGHLHMGTAFNKVLKDVINRSQQMLGKDAHYVPGWDCHGLPIEWKVEEGYRARGQSKDAVAPVDFRRECREFAEHWIDVQIEEFQRLGVEGEKRGLLAEVLERGPAPRTSEEGGYWVRRLGRRSRRGEKPMKLRSPRLCSR